MKKIYKSSLCISFLIFGIFLIKQNVVATKESNFQRKYSTIPLEINSEIVQNIFDELILLEDDFIKDDVYKYSYFRFKNSKNILSNEKKLYIALNSLYKDNQYRKVINSDGTTSIFIKKEHVEDRVINLFTDDNFEYIETEYYSSKECGIVDQHFKNNVYEFVVNECKEDYEVGKMRLMSAEKAGNFINLKIKAFLAIREKNKKGEFTNSYFIQNYNSHDFIDKFPSEDIADNSDTIYANNDINEYIFSFKLKNDKYYLTSVQKS